jgi:predicted  nucleic acid-binding Zn-ribbon protein
MRNNLPRRVRNGTLIFVALALAIPFLGGCSTLGIATTEELDAVNGRLESSNRSTGTRLDALEKDSADLQQTLGEMTASIETLNSQFAEAKTWLETMNIASITEDSQKATAAATAAETRIRLFLTHYLEMLRAQQASLEEQITVIEAKMNESPKSQEPVAPPPADKPADSGGEEESSSSQDG